MSENVLAVSGIVQFSDYLTVERKLKKYLAKIGGAGTIICEDRNDGTSAMVHDFCKRHRISWRGFKPDPVADGKAAIFVMNFNLVGHATHVLAFTDGSNVVVEDVIDKTIRVSKPILVVRCETTPTRYLLEQQE